MKKLIFLIFFSILFYSYHINAYIKPVLINDPHDSLLFDGENDFIPVYKISSGGCKIIVKKAACATGDILVKKAVMGGCDEMDTVYEILRNQVLKKGDILADSSLVKINCDFGNTIILLTYEGQDGTNAEMDIQLAGGDKNSGAMVAIDNFYNFCYKMRRKTPEQNSVDLKSGKMYINISNAVKQIFDDMGRIFNNISKTFNDAAGDFKAMTFNTDRTVTTHNNTQFTIEIKVDGKDTMDVIKVYEGSVTVKLRAPEVNADKKKEIEQAAQDLQNGKITIQEFGQKMKDFQSTNVEYQESMKPVTVTKGNKCTATKSTLLVEPIEAGDVQWWEK